MYCRLVYSILKDWAELREILPSYIDCFQKKKKNDLSPSENSLKKFTKCDGQFCTFTHARVTSVIRQTISVANITAL